METSRRNSGWPELHHFRFNYQTTRNITFTFKNIANVDIKSNKIIIWLQRIAEIHFFRSASGLTLRHLGASNSCFKIFHFQRLIWLLFDFLLSRCLLLSIIPSTTYNKKWLIRLCLIAPSIIFLFVIGIKKVIPNLVRTTRFWYNLHIWRCMCGKSTDAL